MALNKLIADFLAQALAMGVLPPGGDLLELGESIVVPYDTPHDLLSIVGPFIPGDRLYEAKLRVEASGRSKSVYQNAFGPARAFYHAVFEPAFYAAIELGLAPRRLCIDLNAPVQAVHLFDYVINNGTSEHIFDQANVYRVIHDHTRPGGVMIHWTPCLGWPNHGLYNVQPGFFFDLAAANGYEIKLIGLANGDVFFRLQSGEGYRQGLQQHRELAHSLVCAVLRKVQDEPFKAPTQGSYQGGLAQAYLLSKVARHYAAVGRPNLALQKPALQSSTCKWSWHDDPAQDAAGGNNGMITGYYGFHTDLEFEPWWMVDLGSQNPVDEVVVYNRIDTVANAAVRAAHLRIYLSSDGASWSMVFSREEDAAFGGADGRPLRVLTGGQEARFVRLALPGKTILCLDEIGVY
jgi:SAM-dependent methyltransferase